MIINSQLLLRAAPIDGMIREKVNYRGVSYGLSEAGYDIRVKQDIILHPFRRFTLASAIEYFHMPDNLVGIVHDKSTWARSGLSVFNTVVEPGWRGFLTLELVYYRWGILRIPAGSGIAQVVFHQTSDLVSYEGKYQDQEDKPTLPVRK